MSFSAVDTIHTSLGNYEKYKKKTPKKNVRKLPSDRNIRQVKLEQIIYQI